MSYFPNEADLIERMYGLLCNADNFKSGLRWEGNTPIPTGLSQSPDSVAWRKIFSTVRDEYHNWLGYYIATHQGDDTHDLDAEPSIGDLIESLKMLCDCGNCDGAWVSRFEANHIIAKLKRLAELEKANETRN